MRLAAEPFSKPRFSAQLSGQHLNRDMAANHRVVGFVHLAHATLADHLNQAVAPKRRALHHDPSPNQLAITDNATLKL
jgi:hypothetical protein